MRSNNPCQSFSGVDPVTGDALDPQFVDASDSEITAALDRAAEAADALRRFSGDQIKALLEAISLSFESQRDAIVGRCRLETGYPAGRVLGEFERMVAGMRRFGRVAQRGDWLAVRIDHGDPARQPLPKPDLRRMKVPIGPVVVFGASNFPLALSVGGSDVASALAAGCPVVVKAHPSHPGTAQLLAESIAGAVSALKFPDGTFSMLQGVSNFVGQALVEHPAVRAVAFTGSLRGGRAIFDMAARREIPVPVYAEMGSLNPQFVFPELLRDDPGGFAQRLFAAATMGNGQFCTNPSMVFLAGDTPPFIAQYRSLIREYPGAPMLNARICEAFEQGLDGWGRVTGLEVLDGYRPAEGVAIGAGAACAQISLQDFLGAGAELQEELFGPATLFIECSTVDEFHLAARQFGGQLGASLHGTAGELEGDDARKLLGELSGISGRVLINGFPTGLEDCDSLQHGGPYPATTDSHWTSVGTAAIERFGRPVAYQGVADSLLPEALRDANPLGLRRLVDGQHEAAGGDEGAG